VHPTWERTKPDVDDHAGWVFKPAGAEMTNTVGNGHIKYEQAFNDDLYGCTTVRQLYEKAMKDGSDPPRPFSVPILWDKKNETIVNNESSEII
jgi:putative glutathione S-transferase